MSNVSGFVGEGTFVFVFCFVFLFYFSVQSCFHIYCSNIWNLYDFIMLICCIKSSFQGFSSTFIGIQVLSSPWFCYFRFQVLSRISSTCMNPVCNKFVFLQSICVLLHFCPHNLLISLDDYYTQEIKMFIYR